MLDPEKLRRALEPYTNIQLIERINRPDLRNATRSEIELEFNRFLCVCEAKKALQIYLETGLLVIFNDPWFGPGVRFGPTP